MKLLNDLFTNNRGWAERIKAEDPNFFATLSAQQAPEYLWIGCSDSRVPVNQLMGLLPGGCLHPPGLVAQIVELSAISVLCSCTVAAEKV